MKLVSTETSLVIAGAWNPAILTPQWVLQHGLNKSLDGGNLIQAFLPATQGVIFEFPRYVLEDLSFSVRPDLFILSPVESTPERIVALEDAAARMLEQLKHTPITGIGHNFEFREANPMPGNLDLFTASRQDLINNMPDCWEPASASLAASFKNNTDTVIVNIQRQFEADVLIVKFNFHHPISSADDALVVLRGENDYKRMNQNLIFAKQLMTELYGEIEND